MNEQETQLAQAAGISLESDLLGYPFVRDQVQLLPYTFAKQKSALPLEERSGKLLVALARLDDFEVIEEVRSLTGQPIIEVLAPKADLERAIEQCYHQKDQEASDYIEGLKKEGEESRDQEIVSEGDDLFDKKEGSPVVQLLNMILIEAIQQGVSDIHFEPLENEVAIRYRIDGVLQFRHRPPLELQNQLMTRIKVMAKMDIAERRLPQDGRIKLSMAGRQIDFRVSTVPVIHGERIVLRILDKGNITLGLDQIGMEGETVTAFRKYLRQNQGIVFVTGPTGSGKTTTLYSSIIEVNSQEVNVMTVEDPVEYKLPGIAQIGVAPKIGLTFSRGLRHILRQDPDIIMIGEIRDRETAEIAVQSSLTGHLVLSTLHTNDAPSALTRLVDMGVEPYLLSSSTLAVLAQRLVRGICPHCQAGYRPSEEELAEVGLNREELCDGQLFAGKGCEKCFESGYRGRLGIYELMPISQQIKNQLLKSADANELQKVAHSEGMCSLREKGARLALQGKTTTAEVLRVTRQIELYR